MDSDTTALQAFSDSLVGNAAVEPDRETVERLIACLNAENIKNFGAMEAAHIILVRALSSIPELTPSAVSQLNEPLRALFVTYLARDLEMDEALEHLIVQLRALALRGIATDAEIGAFGLDLLSALAVFIFGKEYVLSESQEETAALRALSLFNGPVQVAMIACYRPLYRMHEPSWLLSTETPSTYYRTMLEVQLAEPLEERRLSAEIRSLTPITDTTSMSVRQMYEENPYPRWTRRPVGRPMPKSEGLRVLVAGCGSGRHPIAMALSQPNCHVVGLDLSLASLSYGLRKARAYGVTNLEFVQGDILDLEASGLTFDFITSVGVLHHMANPGAGLRALRTVLAKHGRIELGLYSESGRQAVVEAIALRERLGVPATPDGIRTLRRHIFDLPPPAPARDIARHADFYTMSGCRDLIFHVQEHRLDLQAVDRMLKDAGLVLKRLSIPAELREQFGRQLPDGDQADLLDWAQFEVFNPGIFGSMYNLSAVAV